MSFGIVFGPADVSVDLATFEKIANHDEFISQTYTEVSESIDLPIGVLFGTNIDYYAMSRVKLVSVSLLAVMVGTAKRLESLREDTPVWVGGVSIGELAAATYSGALSLGQAAQLVAEQPDVNLANPEGVAFVFIPNPHSDDMLPQIPNVWLSVDYGQIAGGAGRMIMLSGTRDGLSLFAEECPWETEILPPEMCSSAYHTPLRKNVLHFTKAFLSAHSVSDPRFSVLTCLEKIQVCSSALDVSRALCASEVTPLKVPLLVEASSHVPADEIHCVGPYLRSMQLPFGSRTCYHDELNNYNLT